MALQHRREAAVRPRFLLALTLSTVTALVVAAPLAVRAIRADAPSYASSVPSLTNDPSSGSRSIDDLSSQLNERTLSDGDVPSQGGIGARVRTKAKDQTHKSNEAGTVEGPASATSLLTNDTAAVTEPPETTPTTTPTTGDPAAPTVTASPTAPPTSAPTTSSTTGDGPVTSATSPSVSSTATSSPSTTTTSRPSSTTTEESTTATSGPQPD
jgi:hypothetical protein